MSKNEHINLWPRPILYTLPNGRVCHHYGKGPDPQHVEVMIPLTAAEKKNSNKKAHFQIVRVSNLRQVKETRFPILKELH